MFLQGKDMYIWRMSCQDPFAFSSSFVVVGLQQHLLEGIKSRRRVFSVQRLDWLARTSHRCLRCSSSDWMTLWSRSGGVHSVRFQSGLCHMTRTRFQSVRNPGRRLEVQLADYQGASWLQVACWCRSGSPGCLHRNSLRRAWRYCWLQSFLAQYTHFQSWKKPSWSQLGRSRLAQILCLPLNLQLSTDTFLYLPDRRNTVCLALSGCHRICPFEYYHFQMNRNDKSRIGCASSPL